MARVCIVAVMWLYCSEDEARLEAWVALCDGIERNQLGNTMKEEIVRLGLVARCTHYIQLNAPPNKVISYSIQHCFICRPSDSTVPMDACACALAVRRSYH